MAAIPTIEEEDARRPNRERENLVGQRTRIVNRMKACLTRLGIRTAQYLGRDAAWYGGARVLSWTRSKALDILSARMQSADKIDYEITPLASILADAQAAGLLKEPDLKNVVERLRQRPRILASISGFLIDHHKAFNLARRLWHLRVADARDDAIARSQLARAYAKSGTKEGLADGLPPFLAWAGQRR
jgi:hypothetical protein